MRLADRSTYDGPYAPLRGAGRSRSRYDSVMRISFEVRAGLVMRQIHHWAAAAVRRGDDVRTCCGSSSPARSASRASSTGSIGVTLLDRSAIGAGFTGYSLPDDLLSGTGLRIGYSVVLSIPVIGTWLAYLFFGGEFPAPELLTRLLRDAHPVDPRR